MRIVGLKVYGYTPKGVRIHSKRCTDTLQKVYGYTPKGVQIVDNITLNTFYLVIDFYMNDIKSKDILIKNKILINISGRPTLFQRKLFNIFLYLAYNKLSDFSHQVFKTTLKEVTKLMRYDNKISYYNFKKDLKGLMETIVEWDILDDDGSINEENFGLSSLISSVQIKRGIIEYTIPIPLREILVENKQYVKISLQMQRVFTSKHSIALYEVAKEFYREKDKLGETPWIGIEKLKNLFGLEEDEYSDFKAFKRNLLNKAIGEINQKTDLYLDMELKRDSRKISHIKFKIKYNKNLEFEKQLSLLPEQGKKQDLPESKITKDLLSFGVSKEKINDWSLDYPTEYIQSKLDLVLEKLKQGKIKTSPAGFLVKAIETNFEDKNISISELLEQDALEARKINPETILVDPVSFGSKKDFEAHIEHLKGQFYEPRWLSSEMEKAEEGWS